MRSLLHIATIILLLALGEAGCTNAPPAAPSADAGKKKSIEDDDDDSQDLDSDDELQTDEDTTDDDDDEEADSEDDETDPFEGVRHAEKLESCHEDGFVYDRRTASDDGEDAGECHAAKHPADFDCDKAGIIGAFNNSTNIKNYVAQQETDDFEIDQCGTYDNGKPIVFYTKEETAEDGAAKLRVRVVEPQ